MQKDIKLTEMYTIQIHPTYRRIIAIFIECGIWRNGEISRKLFYLFNMILFQMLIVTCAWISDDKNESLFLAQVEISALVMMVKLIYLLWNKDMILLFLSEAIVTHYITDYEVFVQVKKKIKKFMRFVHVYIAVMASVVFLLVISPLPIFSSDRKLPMFIVYSFDWKYSEVIYWLIYSPFTFQIFLIFATNLLTVIIWYILFNLSIKYKILGNQLMNLGVPKVTEIEIEGENLFESADLFQQQLIHLVKVHQKTFKYKSNSSISLIFYELNFFLDRRLVERFKCSFSGIFIAQIVTSCISICTSNYILTYVSEIVESFICKFLLHFHTILFFNPLRILEEI